MAADVKKGNEKSAMTRIEEYIKRQAVVNEVVQSPAVAENLERDVAELQDKVQDTFAGEKEEVARKQKSKAKALQFGARMLQSGQSLDALASSGVTQPGYFKSMADAVGAGALANWTQNPQQQQVEQSQRDFVNAVLRRESGAAISNSEFDNARAQYFPQPGDSQEVIQQKRRNREIATRGVLTEVPDQQNRVQQVLGEANQAQPGQQRAVARTGTINGRKVVQYTDGSISYAD